MKIFTRLLSLAIIGGGLVVHSAANADTVYHRVYHTSIAAGDAFSILDKYQNNVLTQEEYNNASLSVPFSTVDANHDGFISREEFYAYYRPANISQNTPDLNLIMPAAGGNDEEADDQCRPQY